MADLSMAFPEEKPVTTRAGGERRAPVDSFTADIPAMGGVPEQQAEVGVEDAEAAARANAVKEGGIAVETAKKDEAGAGALADEAAAYRDKVAAFQAENSARMARVAEAADRATDEASSKKYENHWADQSNGTHVLAAISSFLGGLATGTPVNRAQEWIDKDHEQQTQQMQRLWDVAKARGADAEHLSQLMEAGERGLSAEYAGRVEAVKREIEHQAKIKGTEQAAVNAQKMIADLDAKVAERKLKDAKDLRMKAMSHTVRGLNLAKIRTFTLPGGVKAWLNPANGQVEPIQAPAPVAPPPAPVQPAPQVQQ